jgi:hypothetical protein
MLGLSSEFDSDKTEFLLTTNNLFNAMKHTHMNVETQVTFGADYPTIVAYRTLGQVTEDNVVYHNHNAYHLMMGFHDAVDRIVGNQWIFLKAK